MRAPAFVGVVALTWAVLSNCGPCTTQVTPTRQEIVSTPQSSGESGIEGYVTSVVRFGPDRVDLSSPAQVTLSFFDKGDNLVARVQTDEEGYFRLELPPGTYVLRPERTVITSFVEDRVVTVAEGQMAHVKIVYEIPLT